MTIPDQFMLALTLWREARGEGRTGMIAVGCVVRNRTVKHGTSAYKECTKPQQFTSITVKTDPEVALFPDENDVQWQLAQLLANDILDDTIADVTGGATIYYNPNGIASDKTITLASGSVVKFPETWNVAAVSETVVIGAHVFFREL